MKLGFIVEGETERIIIESNLFQSWANEQGLDICRPVIDAGGGGNLLPQNIKPMVEQVQRSNPDHIIVLTDLERDPDVKTVRQRIGVDYTQLIFVAVKAIEAWFLADSKALEKWLGTSWHEDRPEETNGMPWGRLKELANELKARGPGPSKPAFAKKMTKHFGFTVPNAAQHPNCPSAKFFHDGLTNLSHPRESM